MRIVARPEGRTRGEIHDPPALGQHPRRLLAQGEHGHQIDLVHDAEIIRRQRVKVAGVEDAGVVDQHRQVFRPVDQRLRGGRVGDVQHLGAGGQPGLGQLAHGLGRAVSRAVGDDHGKTVLGQTPGDGPPDAGTGARDDGGFHDGH